MKRALLFCAVLSASACISAPKAPGELIVGTWDCKVADSPSGGVYRLDLTPSGEMKQTGDGVWKLTDGQIEVSLEVTATYAVVGHKLEGASPSWKLNKLLVNGAEIPASEQPALKQLLDGFVRRRMSLTIEALDARQLVLSGNGYSTSCGRRAS